MPVTPAHALGAVRAALLATEAVVIEGEHQPVIVGDCKRISTVLARDIAVSIEIDGTFFWVAVLPADESPSLALPEGGER